MKIGGKELVKAKSSVVALPRIGDNGEPDDIIFQCAPVTDYEEFEQLCPRPEPPVRTFPGNKPPQILVNDPKFLKEIDSWSSKRTAWMIITSLKATEGIEWETVNYGDPETWENWNEELNNSGLTDIETSRILQGVMESNSLSEDRMEEARERFLAGQRAQQEK